MVINCLHILYMNIDSSKDNSSSCKKSKIMEHGGAGKLESGSGVVKEVAVESLPDKGEESTGEVENYPEEPERSEENPIDESFESEEEEVRGGNFDPVNTNFHLNN